MFTNRDSFVNRAEYFEVIMTWSEVGSADKNQKIKPDIPSGF